MRMIVASVLLIFICSGIFILSDEDKRWLFFHEKDAKNFAKQLLEGNAISTPDKFVDYSVSSSAGYVLFTKHQKNSVTYGYFPGEPPEKIGGELLKLNWRQIGDDWFVAYL